MNLILLDLISPLQSSQRRSLKSAQERKDEALTKLHKLPIEMFYTEEEYQQWNESKLQRELKRRQLGWEFSTKSEMINALMKSRDSSGEACTVCLEDYESEDVLRVLPCEHRFHIECVDPWIISSTDYSSPVSCPICKKEL